MIALSSISCSNADKIREFIKNVYVDKKFTGGKSSERPPRDSQVSISSLISGINSIYLMKLVQLMLQ